jgi:hypothetical protein
MRLADSCAMPIDRQAAMLHTKPREDGERRAQVDFKKEYHFAMNRMRLSEGKRGKNIAQHDLRTPGPLPVRVGIHKER